MSRIFFLFKKTFKRGGSNDSSMIHVFQKNVFKRKLFSLSFLRKPKEMFSKINVLYHVGFSLKKNVFFFSKPHNKIFSKKRKSAFPR